MEKVKDDFHLVITLSPLSSKFRERIRMYPSLINCCTINWIQPWPDEALKDVASKIFSEGKD